MPKNVDKYVDSEKPKRPRKSRAKLPSHVVEKIEKKDGVNVSKWYVRKSVSVETSIANPETGETETVKKQKQYWRLCEPQTSDRAREVLKELEQDINYKLTGYVKPLSNFGKILDEFEKIELIPAVYEKGRKIAGHRSLNSPKAAVKIIREHFAHRDIHDINFGDIETFKKTLISTPVEYKLSSRPRTIRTVNITLSYFRQVLNFAYRRRYVDRTPFADGRAIIDRTQENRRHVEWTKDEEKRALELCVGGQLAHIRPVIVCITDGGFRIGELLPIKWSDVDFKNKVMLAKSYKNKRLVARPVYMTNRMVETLKEWKKLQATIPGVRDKSKVIGYKDIRSSWATVCAGVGREDMHIHDLRHVFGTRLIRAGASVKDASVLLGHSNTTTTEIYLNLSESDLRSSVEKLEKFNEKDD